MNDQRKTLFLLALICATVFFLTRAHAQEVSSGQQPPVAAAATNAGAASAEPSQATKLVRSAAQQLQQAALQRDFMSNAQELEMLQAAHDTLVSAIKMLCCRERERAAQLASDIEHALVRDSTYLGPLDSPGGEQFGPSAPTRDQLAQLAQEGQELVRDAPVMHRLIDADASNMTSGSPPASPQRVNEYPQGPLKTDPFYLPADKNAATTQFQFHF